MGLLKPGYNKAIIDSIIAGINANTAQYYAFAGNPVTYDGAVPAETADDLTSAAAFNQSIEFGKKLANTDFAYMIRNIVWTANTNYARYDNTIDISNSDYYVIAPPAIVGGDYLVFKCIDNNGNGKSTEIPDQIQTQSFTKSDSYTWRYVASISDAHYKKFATADHVPLYSNSSVIADADLNAGVEVVVVSNGGTGYACHHDGQIQSIVNTSVLQIELDAASDNDFYVNNSIYIYNDISVGGQLLTIADYVANTTGRWVYVSPAANTDSITTGVTNYKITPRLVFDHDGTSDPKGYVTINTTSNSILSAVIVDPGTGISRVSVSVVSNTVYGSGANLYCIAPPPGGHGSDVFSELKVSAIGIGFQFSGTESNTISGLIPYNKIGIITGLHALNANNTKGSAFSSNTFSQVLRATVSPSATFTVGELVTGNTSGAKGYVAFSNSTTLMLTGDKDFSNGEYITSSNGSLSTAITISTLGDIYTKSINPLYVQNTDNIQRSNTQNEAFKIVISFNSGG
jgi:hypothetical protein